MLTLFCGGGAKNAKHPTQQPPWWKIPINPMQPTKLCGFPGHGVFPGILLLQGGGGRGEKDFKGLERWDEHPAAE